MDTDHFDVLAVRAANNLTRRRSLGFLGALAALGMGMSLADDAEAKKKKKKRRRHSPTKPTKHVPPPVCTGCTACQTCVNGVCQALPENSACGTAGVCIKGTCSRTCDPFNDTCPAGSTCYGRVQRDDGVCVLDSVDICFRQECSSDSACPQGEACSDFTCIDLKTHCAPALAG